MNARAYILPRPTALQRDGSQVFASGFLATLVMTTIMFVPTAGRWELSTAVTGAEPAAARRGICDRAHSSRWSGRAARGARNCSVARGVIFGGSQVSRGLNVSFANPPSETTR